MKAGVIDPHDDQWQVLRCSCGIILCRIVPKPGMAVETICRKCGKVHTHSFEAVDISKMQLDDMKTDILDQVRTMFGET